MGPDSLSCLVVPQGGPSGRQPIAAMMWKSRPGPPPSSTWKASAVAVQVLAWPGPWRWRPLCLVLLLGLGVLLMVSELNTICYSLDGRVQLRVQGNEILGPYDMLSFRGRERRRVAKLISSQHASYSWYAEKLDYSLPGHVNNSCQLDENEVRGARQ